jgi:hypothetical protein
VSNHDRVGGASCGVPSLSLPVQYTPLREIVENWDQFRTSANGDEHCKLGWND